MVSGQCTSDSRLMSSYARTYIEKIDKQRTAKNYTLALKHLEKYMGTCELMFQSLTESRLNSWIETMIRDGKKRAKEMYSAYMEMRVPDLIKPLFKKYNSSHKKGPLFCFHEMSWFCSSCHSNICEKGF